MEEFYFSNYDDEDVAAAVKAVIGDNVVCTCIDDEHNFWFLLNDENETPTYEDNASVDSITDFYTVEECAELQAFLEKNCKAVAW